MTRACPLPVDWLDYLDGKGDPALTQHLASCWSCQRLLESLKAGAAMDIPQRWTDGLGDRFDAVWHEDRPVDPSPAEFWFSGSQFTLGSFRHGASSFQYADVDRVLVLVLSAPDHDHELGWTDVVPVLSDVEAATETDLLFTAQENTLNAPWRALFAHQLKVARGQLDTRVGSLTEVGLTALTAALAGESDDARWGMPLQHSYDPRASLDDQVEEAIKRLRTPWLIVHASDDEQGGSDNGPLLHVVVEPDSTERTTGPDEPPDHDVVWLRAGAGATSSLAFAAASAATTEPSVWIAETKQFKLHGKLGMDFENGMLIFVIIHSDLHTGSRLRLHVEARGRWHVSEPFRPEQHHVPIVKNVTSAEVKKLGAETLP